MTDIQYWDDTLTEEIDTIQKLVDGIVNMNDSKKKMEKAAAIDKTMTKIKAAGGTKRSFKMEIRLVSDVNQRRKYESRLAALTQMLKGLTADCKALEAECNRGELFLENGGDGGDEDGEVDGVKAGDSMLKEAAGLQDKTQDSLANTKKLIAESKEVGVETLEELQRQREVLTSIDNEVTRIDDSLARAEVLLKQFGKRMAGDHFIQCFALLNCLLFLGVIAYIIITKKTLGRNPDESIPLDPTNPFAGVFGGNTDTTDTATTDAAEDADDTNGDADARYLLDLAVSTTQHYLRGAGEN